MRTSDDGSPPSSEPPSTEGKPQDPVAALPPEVAAWIGDVVAEIDPPLTGETTAVQLLRGGRKALATVTHGGELLVLKRYVDDEGALTTLWLQRLTAAGLVAPSRFLVAPARWWSPRHRTQVMDRARGSAWGDWLTGSDALRQESSIAVADWLTALQQLPVVLEDRTGQRSASRLRKEAASLADAFPDERHALARIAGAAAQRLEAEAGSLVPSHGDLHLDELFLAPGQQLVVTGVDLDTAGLRRPSSDVGFALAMLLVSSRMRHGSFRGGAVAGRAFWKRWAPTGQDLEAVPAQMARSLVMSLHLELVAYRTGRDELLRPWLDIAGAAVSSGVEAALSVAEEVG